MSVVVWGCTLVGVEAAPVAVEVDLLRRLPQICIVGLADHAVRESAERVRSAITAAGFEFPRKRVVVNLAPADLRKEGTGLDLAIALGVALGVAVHLINAAAANEFELASRALAGEPLPPGAFPEAAAFRATTLRLPFLGRLSPRPFDQLLGALRRATDALP